MIKTKTVGLLFVLASMMVTLPVFANGLSEDRSWQFKGSAYKFLRLNEEVVRLKLDAGGYKQIFNVTAEGATSVYVGNNSQTWVADDQVNSTSVGNMTEIHVGDGATGNTISSGQDNSSAAQHAVGASLTGDGGYAVGQSVTGTSGATTNNTGS